MLISSLLNTVSAYRPGNKEARILAHRMGIKPYHFQSRPDHVDLHLHSWHSDGFYSPSQLATAAHFMGLKAVALTDNESFAGRLEMQAACDRFKITNIPGIEFHIRDHHPMRLVGYHMSFTNPVLLNRLNQIHAARQAYIKTLLEHLKQKGFEINPLDIEKFFPAGLYCKQQVAEILAVTKKVPSFKDAMEYFWRWTADSPPLIEAIDRIESLYFTLDEALLVIHTDGGIPIWVNLGPRLLWQPVALQLLENKQWGPEGIMGFELIHGRYNHDISIDHLWLINKLTNDARICPLLTLGSDFHDGRREQFGLPYLPPEVGKADELMTSLQAAKEDKSIIVMR